MEKLNYKFMKYAAILFLVIFTTWFFTYESMLNDRKSIEIWNGIEAGRCYSEISMKSIKNSNISEGTKSWITHINDINCQ